MILNKVNIVNYKSIKNIFIENPSNFSVFVGANASGKSNIFEALEFSHLLFKQRKDALKLFENFNDIFNVNTGSKIFSFKLGSYTEEISIDLDELSNFDPKIKGEKYFQNYSPFLDNFSRIFIGKNDYTKLNIRGDIKLSLECNNLESVLKRILKDIEKRDEFLELLTLLIPEFKDLEIVEDSLTKSDQLLIYERYSNKPFGKKLLSDGTINILCLITTVLQDDKQQFLCIEEPENGLNPKVVKELVNYFRDKCSKKGHFIWLNTHSQSLVSELEKNEIVIVNKIEGETKIKQIQDLNLYNLKLDEAWLSNAFGGGIPW